MIGKTVSHYKILDKLGEGGMGVVYKAQDTKLDRLVALKFLPPHVASDQSEKERFFQEARSASALSHPNITVIYEINEAEGQVYIAMEYIEGKTLNKLIERGPLPLKKVLDIAIQACDGLAAAHKKGMIHRDIKSDNIMVTSEGQVKITDFGLAKFRGQARLTQLGTTLGTAAYMSPEQASGEEVDQRSDIFSFGVVLYELLTGQLPFKGEHQAAVIYSILNEEPQPVARFNNKVSPDLERIVGKALSKDKEERYQHVDDLQADLRREKKSLEYLRSGQVTTAVVPPKPKRRLLPVLIPGSIVIVLAVLFFILKPFKLEVGPEQKAVASENSLAVLYFENLADPEDKDHTGEMLTNLLITALSQGTGLEVVSRERLYDIQQQLGQTNAKTISPSLASQIAQRAGVKTMLLGSVLQTQPQLAVTTRLIEVSSGRIVNSQRITGYTTNQFFALVDSLAILVRKDLSVAPSPEAETKSVAEATTSSPEAYRCFLEAVELNKRFYTAEAMAALNRALELDSSFAMAYFLQSQLGEDQASRRKGLQKAWELKNKVTERERLWIESAYAGGIENNLPKAAEILEKLLQKFPHSQNAYVRLGGMYENLHDYQKTIQTFQRGLKTDSLDKIIWNSLAYAHAGLGQKKEALDAVDQYLKLAPAEPNPYDSKGEIYFLFGDIDSALFWYQKAIKFRTDFITIEKLGFNAVLRQDYARAEEYFRQYGSTADRAQKAWAEDDQLLILVHKGQLQEAKKQLLEDLSSYQIQKLPDHVMWGYLQMAINAYDSRDYPAMLEYAKKCVAEARKNPGNVIYGRGLLAWAYLKNGDSKMAHKIMGEIRNDIKGKASNLQNPYYDSEGMLAFEEGKFDLALEWFQKALQPQYPYHAPQFFYAVALLKTGHMAEAVSELERSTWWSPISTPSISLPNLLGSIYWPTASVKAHCWLGVAYEQTGDKAKAIAEYEKFLDIWKDADPGIAEIETAKMNLAELKKSA